MTDSSTLLRRYYLFETTNSAGFYVPVAILYLQDQGFGLDFIGVAYAVFGLATLMAEIPTGYVGDWLGRRASLAVGSAGRALVLLAYPVAETQLAYLALHVVWATARSFRSGTQDAWLYELLEAHYDPDDFARIRGRGNTVLLVTSAVGAVAGGFLYSVHPAYPFVVNAGLAGLGIPLLFTIPAVTPRSKDSGPTADGSSGPDRTDIFTIREAVDVLRVQLRRPSIRWVVSYLALFQALFLVTRIYEQPALDAVGVPATGLGLLYAGFKLVSAGAASATGWVKDRFSTRSVFVLLIPMYGLAYASIVVVPLLVVPVLFLNRGLRVIVTPIRNQYLNDRLDDIGRATVLSGVSMVLAFAGVIARLVAAQAVLLTGPVQLLPWAGSSIAIGATIVWVATSPARTGTPDTLGEDPDHISTD